MSEDAEDMGELVLTVPQALKLDAQLSMGSYLGSNLLADSNLDVEPPSTDEGVGVDLVCVPVVIDGDNESWASWLCDDVDELDEEDEDERDW